MNKNIFNFVNIWFKIEIDAIFKEKEYFCYMKYTF